MQPGKQAEIRPLGNGKGLQRDEITDTSISCISASSASSKLTNDNAAAPGLPARKRRKVTISQAKRPSEVLVGQSSVDGELILIDLKRANLQLLLACLTLL